MFKFLLLTSLVLLLSCKGNDYIKGNIDSSQYDSTNIIISKRYNIKRDELFFEKMFGGEGSLKTLKGSQSIVYYKLLTLDPIQINDSLYILPKINNSFHDDSILDGPNVFSDRLKDKIINVLLDSNIYEWNNKYKLCSEKREYGIRFINNNDTVDVCIGAYCRNIYFYRGSKYIGYQYLKEYSNLFHLIHVLYPKDIFFENYFQSEIKLKHTIDLYNKIEVLFVDKYELDKIVPIKNNNDTLAYIGFSYSKSLDSIFPKRYLSIIKSKINHSWMSDENKDFILRCFDVDLLSRFINKSGIIELELLIGDNFKIMDVKILYNTINESICDCLKNDLKELDFSSHEKYEEIKKYLPVKIKHAWAIMKHE